MRSSKKSTKDRCGRRSAASRPTTASLPGGRRPLAGLLSALVLLARSSSASPPRRRLAAPPAAIGEEERDAAPAGEGRGETSTKPRDFLRWRKASEVRGSKNKTISNDFNNHTGAFVDFGPLGLQLRPVATPPDDRTHSGEMELLRHAVEGHLNETLKRLALADFSVGGHFAFARVDEVRFVEFVPAVSGRKLMDFEAVDAHHRPRARQHFRNSQPSSSSAVVSISGRAFYLYGLGGFLLASMPAPADLGTIVTNGVEGGNDGEVLAGRIRESASGGIFDEAEMFESVESIRAVNLPTLGPTESPSTLAPSWRPTESTPFPTDKPVDPPAEQVTVGSGTSKPPTVEPSTFSPVELILPGMFPAVPQTVTDAPSLGPAPLPSGNEEGDTATIDTDDAEATDKDENSNAEGGGDSGGVEGNSGGNSSDDYSIIGSDEGDENGDGRDGDSDGGDGGKPNIAEANTASDISISENGDGNDIKNILVAAGCILLATSVAALLYIHRKRRRESKDDDESYRSDAEEAMKGVPMCKLSDDGCCDDVCEDVFSGTGGDGAADTTQDTFLGDASLEIGRETESHEGTGQGAYAAESGDGVSRTVVPTSPQSSRDWEFAYDKMVANAVACGGCAADEDDAVGQPADDSVSPQVRDVSYEITTVGEEDDDGGGGADANKDRPLSGLDSLDEKYPSTYALQRSRDVLADELKGRGERNRIGREYSGGSSQDIADLDILISRIDSASRGDSEEVIVFDDIEEAMRLANDAAASGDDDADFIRAVSDATNPDALGNDGQVLNSSRENSTERGGPSEGPRSFSDVLNADSFGSHEILKNIKEAAAERKRSSGSRESSQEIERVIEFASFPNIASGDGDFLPAEQNPFDSSEEKNCPILKDPEEGVSRGVLKFASFSDIASNDKEVDFSLEKNSAISKDPDEGAPLDILNAINDAARSTPSLPLRLDRYVSLEESSAISMARDPPGSIASEILDQLRMAEYTDLVGLRTAAVVEDDRLSSFAAARAGCTNTFVEQTKESLPNRSSARQRSGNDDGTAGGRATSPDDAAGGQESAPVAPKGKWNPFPSGVPKPGSCTPAGCAAAVSDDEDEGYDAADERNVSRPWKARWDDDPFASGAGIRTVSPKFESADGGSNYDPDSDWDVDDTEVDFEPAEESFEPTSPADREFSIT